MDSSYKTLEKQYYIDKTSDRAKHNKELAKSRLMSDSSFRTGIQLKTEELFFIVPKELSLINELVLKLERKVSSLWKKLPGIAQAEYIRNLILAEIIETNEMEGVRSTKKQVINAIDKAEKKSSTKKTDLFVEFVFLYLQLVDSEIENPETPEDIREIYDSIVEGTIKDEDLPDGELFRSSGVEITTKSDQIIHEGVFPEEKIYFMLKEMIALANSNQYPQLYSAILSHFLFEYIHPFYDGNGRTGRYLLAKYLSTPLSLPTVLSLSKTIAENKERYYKAFEITEGVLNHAEATHFIITIMQLIKSAQDGLIMSLTEKHDQLDTANYQLGNVERVYKLNSVECEILYYAIQVTLFGVTPNVEMADMVDSSSKSKQTVRRAAKQLEEKGLLEVSVFRPLAFTLTTLAKQELQLSK